MEKEATDHVRINDAEAVDTPVWGAMGGIAGMAGRATAIPKHWLHPLVGKTVLF